MREFHITIDIAAPAERVWQVMRVVARHGVESTAAGSRATLSLELQGIFGGLFGWITGAITERYLGFEANGLKTRSENPGFRRIT